MLGVKTTVTLAIMIWIQWVVLNTQSSAITGYLNIYWYSGELFQDEGGGGG